MQLTGSGTTPGTNDAVTSLRWSVYSSGAGKVIATGSGHDFTYTPSAAGVDVVTLTVTNAGGASNSTSVVIPVTAAPLDADPGGHLPGGDGCPGDGDGAEPAARRDLHLRLDGGGADGRRTASEPAPASASSCFTAPARRPVPGERDGHRQRRQRLSRAARSYGVALAPLTATIFGAPQSGLAGQPITLTDPVADASRKGPFTYQWTRHQGQQPVGQPRRRTRPACSPSRRPRRRQLSGQPDRHRQRDQPATRRRRHRRHPGQRGRGHGRHQRRPRGERPGGAGDQPG